MRTGYLSIAALLALGAVAKGPIEQIDSTIGSTLDTTKEVGKDITKPIAGEKKIEEPSAEPVGDIKKPASEKKIEQPVGEMEKPASEKKMEQPAKQPAKSVGEMEKPASEKKMEQPAKEPVGEMKKEIKTSQAEPIVEEPVGMKESEFAFDFNKLFERGFCPEGVEGMKNLEYARLSGDWFLQRMDEPFVPEMLPKCHHCQLEVDASGDFSATEEVQFGGRNFIVNEIEGSFDGPTLEAEFFGEKLQVSFTILDTDYDNYMIGYECFDNMQFVMESGAEIEPVHIISLGIATRNPNATKESMDKLEEKTLKMLPFLTKEDIAVIEQGDQANCDYLVEF